MHHITLQQLDTQLKSLAEEISSLHGEIDVRKKTLAEKEEIRQMTLRLRDAQYPSTVIMNEHILVRSEANEQIFKIKKRRKIVEYFPYITEILKNGSSPYKKISNALRLSMNDSDIKDGYVYKILRRMEEQSAGVMRDPNKEGNFMLSSNSDARPVTGESGRQNQIASVGSEAVTF